MPPQPFHASRNQKKQLQQICFQRHYAHPSSDGSPLNVYMWAHQTRVYVYSIHAHIDCSYRHTNASAIRAMRYMRFVQLPWKR